jgi:uncharacterized protein (TIGR02284 family)
MDKRIEAVNDLIEINNDRIAGYERAANESRDEDLRSLFNNMASQSRRFAGELKQVVTREGGEPEAGSTLKGKIYRAWMDVKAAFTGHDRKSILASCEFGEDAAQHAYEAALKQDELQGDARLTVENQRKQLRESHDKIKTLRDTQPAG